jgi:hypothetical protein
MERLYSLLEMAEGIEFKQDEKEKTVTSDESNYYRI